MTFITLSAGLTLKVPTNGTRNWGTIVLNDNFSKISAHDHTGAGKGLQISRSAISPQPYTDIGAVTYTTTGGMTVTSSALTCARYQQVGKRVDLQIVDAVTLAGVAGTTIKITLPVASKYNAVPMLARVSFGGAFLDIVGSIEAATELQVIKSSNFTLGANAVIRVSGSYEAA